MDAAKALPLNATAADAINNAAAARDRPVGPVRPVDPVNRESSLFSFMAFSFELVRGCGGVERDGVGSVQRRQRANHVIHVVRFVLRERVGGAGGKVDFVKQRGAGAQAGEDDAAPVG